MIGEGGGASAAEAIAWLRGEFTAANAIIDVLCGHLGQISELGGAGREYEGVFAAIHRRRMNWIPVLHMQKFFSISEVASELNRLLLVVSSDRYEKSKKINTKPNINSPKEEVEVDEAEYSSIADAKSMMTSSTSTEVLVGAGEEKSRSCDGGDNDRKVPEDSGGGGVSGGSSQEDHSSVENGVICSDHEECTTRRERIKISKGFMVKEQIKGHMVNVVKGLKVFEDVFMDSELSKLGEFINELRAAGRNGELSGETFIFFNKELKGNKREIIQLGVPIFQHATDGETGYIEPIPSILQDVIDHLVQWHLISPSKKPNSCLINFFDEGDHSQPYFKPPHLDHPISTLVLSETTMAFGRALTSDNQGNYKGSLTLNIKEGSLVVMRGHSADVARHVVCPSENSRVLITFAKVRACSPNQLNSSSPTKPASFVPQALVPAWGMALQAPIIMFPSPPTSPVVGTDNAASKEAAARGGNGTGVFLPWTMGSKKYIKQLPPRIQKRRLPSLPPLLRMQVDQAATTTTTTTPPPISFVCS